MYHRIRIQTLFMAFIIGSFIFLPESFAVGEPPKVQLPGVVSVSAETDWPLLPNAKRLKKRPTAVEIYQFDESPIGNRAPLLMVHGLLGEYWDGFRWRKLISHLLSDPDFSKRYKIILARYDTHALLKDIVPSFKVEAAKVSDSFGGQPLKAVALSIGGNVLQDAMRDGAFSKRIDSVLTLGTPFHGSPLFTTNWLEYSMMKHYHTPVSRLDSALPYRLYFNKHKNLVADLRWDDSDRMIPDVGKFQFYVPMPISGVLSPASTTNQMVAGWNEPGKIDKSKFTVYGAYMLSDYATADGPNELTKLLKVPYRFTVTLLPEHLGREHPVLRALNQHIARAITNSNSTTNTHGPRYTYGLNDGIAPVSSSLYLPSAAMAGLAVTQANVPSLKGMLDVKRARLFKNIDHLTFIDDYHPLGAAEALKDELEPELAARSIFDWIKSDLLAP